MKYSYTFLVASALLFISFSSARDVDVSNSKLDTSINSDKPSLYVLAIGICKYQNYPRRNPAYACKDARDFGATIEQGTKNNFEKIDIQVLVDDEANQASIQSAIKKIIVNARANDTFIFFYSGHGESEGYGKNQQFYLVPSDFDHAKKHRLRTNAVSASQLQHWFLQVESRHQFIILDSHKSSQGFQEFKARIDHENQILRPLGQRDVAILSIGSLSLEFSRLKNGLLTYITLEGLKGGAASKGAVTVKNLVNYVKSSWQSVLWAQRNGPARALLRRFPRAGRPDIYFSGDDFVLSMSTVAPSRANNNRNRQFGQATIVNHHLQQSSTSSRYIPNPQCKLISTIRPATNIANRAGKDFALLIGTDNYDHWDTLPNPIRDAEAIAKELNNRFGFETEVLRDPNIDCITDALYRYGRNKTYPDGDYQLLIFFAGHGIYRDDLGAGFLMAKDSPRVDLTGRNFYPHALIRRLVDNIPCKHIFLIIDACFSGTIDRHLSELPEHTAEIGMTDQYEFGRLNGPNFIDISDSDGSCDFITRKMQRYTRQLMTSGGKEYVPDGSPGGHSPFTKSLLASLREASRDRPYAYVSQIFPLMAKTIPEPFWAPWGKNEPRSEFFFFTNECKNEN